VREPLLADFMDNGSVRAGSEPFAVMVLLGDQLMYQSLRHICLLHTICVCVWKREASGLFLALVMDECLVLFDDQAQFLALKSQMEAMFEVTLQEGAVLRFLNMRTIQSPASIITNQIDHIVETIVESYFKD
jgi:hypothetical protein